MILKLWKKRLHRPEAVRVIIRDWSGGRGPVLESRIHLHEAAQWILRAQAATPDGGVSAGYSFEDGWIASYPETTGYIIPTLLGYANYARNPLYRDHALTMAEWELSVQLDSGAFPGHFVDRSNPPIVFNTGQIIFGLIAAYLDTQSERFLAAAKKAGAWLVAVQDKDGAWRQFDYRGVAHSYNTRTAWAMVELALLTNDEPLLQAAERHLRWALEQQQENGWFRNVAFLPDQAPFLHTIAYAVQGLLEAGIRLNCKDYITGAERTCRALVPFVGSDGAIPGTFDSHWQPTARYSCLTGNAQMAASWLRLYQVKQEPIFRECAEKANCFLKSLQDCRTDNLGIRGAIQGSYPITGRYLFGTYPNWATKFFMDTLLLEESVRSGQNAWVPCW